MYICLLSKIKEVETDEFVHKNMDWLKQCDKKETFFKNKTSEWGWCEKEYYYIKREWCVEKKEGDNESNK